jgi:hypothetical protein
MTHETLDAITRFLETAAARGIGLTFLALLGLLIVGGLWMAVLGARKWLPKLFEEHIDFLRTTKEATTQIVGINQQTASAIKTLTESKLVEHRKTHRAMTTLSQAAKLATHDSDVHDLLDRAIDELRDS